MAWQQLLAQGISDTVNAWRGDYYNKVNDRKARKKIQYTVQDARAAGIHPLAALGAGMSSPPPVSNLQVMGQDATRALASTMNPAERKLQRRAMEAEVRKAEADADLAAATAKDYQNNVSKPINNVETVPAQVTSSVDLNDNRHVEAGMPSEVKFYHTATGGIGSTASADLKQLIEESPEQYTTSAKRMLHNVLGSDAYKPPRKIWSKKFPKAVDVRFSLQSMDWQPVYRTDGGKPKNWKDRAKRVFFPSEKKSK